MTEEFTAAAMCPRCSAVDVWPWREPRKAPKGDDPISVAQRRIAASIDHANLWIWHGDEVQVRQFGGAVVRVDNPAPPPKTFFDPDDAVVVRQCRCGHEWGQR